MKRLVLVAFAGMFLSLVGFAASTQGTADDDKEGTIPGVTVARAQGGYLGVELKNSTFQITFYDAKKHPVAADRTSAILRWAVHYQPNDERTELVPTGDAAVLGNSYVVKPPYNIRLHVTLLGGGTEEPETYLVDFSA
jgi:hypothetical protein